MENLQTRKVILLGLEGKWYKGIAYGEIPIEHGMA